MCAPTRRALGGTTTCTARRAHLLPPRQDQVHPRRRLDRSSPRPRHRPHRYGFGRQTCARGIGARHAVEAARVTVMLHRNARLLLHRRSRRACICTAAAGAVAARRQRARARADRPSKTPKATSGINSTHGKVKTAIVAYHTTTQRQSVIRVHMARGYTISCRRAVRAGQGQRGAL
jgi:hypothetical protein